MDGGAAGPPGRQSQLTHLQSGLSRGGSSGGGGGGGGVSAAPRAPGREMLASATASCPISVSGGGCGWSPASRASRPRAGPYPRLTPPPPRLPAVQARPPGCTPGRGVRKRPPGRRAWGDKGAQARPEQGEQRCWLCLGSAAWAPPPGAPPPPVAGQGGAWVGGRGGATSSAQPGLPTRGPWVVQKTRQRVRFSLVMASQKTAMRPSVWEDLWFGTPGAGKREDA